MEVELKKMLNDLDYLKKSLSNPSNLASSIHKGLLKLLVRQKQLSAASHAAVSIPGELIH